MRPLKIVLLTPAILLFSLVPCRSQVIDCIVAEVNGKVITLTDVRILQAFAIGPEQRDNRTPSTLRQALDEAINRRVVIDLVQEDIEVSKAEADELLIRWKERYEAGPWQEKLAAFGLRESGLRPYLEEMIRFVKIIGLRFGEGIDVSLSEIEDYYSKIYAPSEREEGREPKPLTQALEEIEGRIRREKAGGQAASWVQSLRSQAEVRINDRCLEQAR
jgi:peptidyl-prolyl cis-trans isomerase SurA